MNLFRLKNGNSTNHKFNQRALFLIPLVLGCLALLPSVQAVTAKVATPTFAPDGKTSSLHSVSVKISCSTSGATIRYTTDGSTPTSTHGTIITSGSSVTIFPPRAGMTLKAMAYKSGLTNSAVKSANYYWDPSGSR
jgi:hypothetical protein